jgi:hypothetical protein
MSQWGKTKYIDGITFIPYINDSKITKDSYIYDIYVSDARKKTDEEVKTAIELVKSDWIGRLYNEWNNV